MNINDPAGVKALLEQLRASQAWQEAMASQQSSSSSSTAPSTGNLSSQSQSQSQGAFGDSGSSSSLPPSLLEQAGSAPASVAAAAAADTSSSSSVALLLSQLQAVPKPAARTTESSTRARTATDTASIPFNQPPSLTSFEPPNQRSFSSHGIPSSSSSSSSIPVDSFPAPAPVAVAAAQETHEVHIPQDPRSMSFQQALPHLAKLAENPRFVSTLMQLKKEQDDLERQIWEDRRDIYRKYEEKVKVAVTKASMIGDQGVSKHEADMLQIGLRTALENFDRGRVLHAWDGLVAKQQTALGQFGVPTMFQTDEPGDRERQQRVMQVLGGILQS